jgi:hypothetical protein
MTADFPVLESMKTAVPYVVWVCSNRDINISASPFLMVVIRS